MGPSVGLPEGQMGNSEVGHLNLGAGAIVPQDLARIDKAVEDGSLGENEVLQAALEGRAARAPDRAGERRRRALVRPAPEGADRAGRRRRVIVHAFTDGRDTSPKGGAKYLADVESWGGRVGSVIGRYFAMDRDKRWDRVQKAYDLLVHGKADHHVDTAAEAAAQAYERDETDEFISADARRRGGAHPARRLRDRVQLPARPDARDHARAVRSATFTEIDRGGAEVIDRYITLAEYDEEWDYPVVFPPKRPSVTIGSVIAEHGLGPAARGRDREVPARHVLLQRRRGDAVRGRGARARALSA